MTYQALAILHEDGMLDIRWADPDGEHPAAMTVVAFGDLLRDAAPYLPDADAATALVANMNTQGAFEPWAYTVITASRQGEITFTAADQKAWYRALGAGETVAATQPSAQPSTPVSPLSAASGASGPAPVSLASAAVPASSASPASAASPAAAASPTSGVDALEAPVRPRRSFLTDEAVEEPARQGWRGALTRLGMRVRPGSAERSERADILAVSQHWPGHRLITVANGKGGSGKTPATVMLAAVLARCGGAGVLAIDANQTRGTLGWRTQKGSHDATVIELLPEIPRLLGTTAQSADMAHFVHHQPEDRFDVLQSQPLALASAQRLTPNDLTALLDVAAKYYRVSVVDTGNDESAAEWRTLVDHAHRLVVPTTTRDDHAEAGALLLEALTQRDAKSAALADRAVVIVSQADPGAKPADLRRIINGYRELGVTVVAIPHDPAMVGGRLLYSALRPATQRAWLAAAAAVARGL
jgi:hypothetical protein